MSSYSGGSTLTLEDSKYQFLLYFIFFLKE